jgi:hypothetical protein
MLDICKYGKLGMHVTIITLCQNALREGKIGTFIEYSDYYEISQLYLDLEPYEVYEHALEVNKIIEVLNLLKTLNDYHKHKRETVTIVKKIKDIIFVEYQQNAY